MHHKPTNVTLSADELELVTNAQILLTKNQIIQKVYAMFGELASDYNEYCSDILPLEILQKQPKIARGENYDGLPYVMLDYPRQFSKNDTFAIRTFFWWGNFFSITIQLSGTYYNMLLPKFEQAADQNLLNDWYIGINENLWLHHFEETNYALKNSDDMKTTMHKSSTLKLAKKIPLSEWDNVAEFLRTNFKLLLSIIKS
jgi:hypothetical protein